MPDPTTAERAADLVAEPAAPPADGPPHAGGGLAALRHVEHVMGTAVSIDVRDPHVPASALEDALAYLHDIDRRFSPYREDSEISRIGRGELALADASAEVRWIMGLCDDLARLSDGYFDARGYRSDGIPDPTGVVKGWAAEEAAFLLIEAGAANFILNAGGDIVARGEPEPGLPWRIGIRHPHRPDRLATAVEVRDACVATSGTYERGLHVIDPHTGSPVRDVLSLTVVGPSLTYADAYATAALAMGERGVAWLAAREGYEAFAVIAGERTIATPGFGALAAR